MIPGGRPPVWAAVLMAAEDWSKAPWEIAGDDDKVKWFFRWAEFRHYRMKAEEAQQKRAARRRNG